jgi:phosphopantothenoylcysteine synthetase/decarboxylase
LKTKVLYLVACGAPPTRYVGEFVGLAKAAGWDVCVIVTPDGRKFVDSPQIAAATGHPVRSVYKQPGDLDVLPDAHAIVVAPVTVNTVNKWSAGIADTLALGLIIEGQGRGLPIVAIPFTNTAMAAHPTFGESIGRLRSWGVHVLYGDEVLRLHHPGTGESSASAFPWHKALDRLHEVTSPA